MIKKGSIPVGAGGYDEGKHELAGITVVGLRARLLRGLAEQKA